MRPPAQIANADTGRFYSFSWSQLQGSGHSHSCDEGSPDASSSLACSFLSMRRRLASGLPSVKSIDLIVRIEEADTSLAGGQEGEKRGHHTLGPAGVTAPERGDRVVHRGRVPHPDLAQVPGLDLAHDRGGREQGDAEATLDHLLGRLDR